MNRPVCSFYSVGHVDATAIVSLVAIGAVIVIWSYLILATSFQGGISAWKRGLIYYISYSLALVGLLMQLIYAALWELYWSEDQPTCTLPKELLFLVFLGFPLTLIPPILINWRILCLYIPTYDYRMRKNSPMHFKDRGTVWLMIRFAILYIPNIIGYILVLTVGSDISWVTAAYQSMLCALMIAVSIALIVLKEEMQESNPVLVKHALYTCGFSFLLAAVFISKTVTFYVYPNNSISGDVLDLTIAISIFLSAVAVLLLWGHYLKFVGREHENQGRRLVVGKAVADGNSTRIVFATAGARESLTSHELDGRRTPGANSKNDILAQSKSQNLPETPGPSFAASVEAV